MDKESETTHHQNSENLFHQRAVDLTIGVRGDGGQNIPHDGLHAGTISSKC
jgi:hypothetical protein